MTVEVRVVTKPGESFLSAWIGGTGNWPLYKDMYIKGAEPILTVREMVTKVIQKAQSSGGTVDYVQINGHGNDESFEIGNEEINLKTLPNHREELAKMSPYLSPNAAIEVSACRAGAAQELFRQLSLILGGRAIIGFLLQQKGGRGDIGPRVIVTPGGVVTPPRLAAGAAPPAGPPPTE